MIVIFFKNDFIGKQKYFFREEVMSVYVKNTAEWPVSYYTLPLENLVLKGARKVFNSVQ